MIIKCEDCNGTGDMPKSQIDDHYSVSNDPVCIRYGCKTCQGLGEVEGDDQ